MTEGNVSVVLHPMHVHVQASCVFHEQLGCLTTPQVADAYAQPEKYESLTNLCGMVRPMLMTDCALLLNNTAQTSMEHGLLAQS